MTITADLVEAPSVRLHVDAREPQRQPNAAVGQHCLRRALWKIEVLFAVGVDTLQTVALVVVERDADQRQTGVRRRLHVIPSEHAEPA